MQRARLDARRRWALDAAFRLGDRLGPTVAADNLIPVTPANARILNCWLMGGNEGRRTKSAGFAYPPRIVGGRYGLSSKEFTPAMAKAVFDNLAHPEPLKHFTVGIADDVTHTSLDYDRGFTIESDRTVRCIFWGLGSDGTVGANKNSIKIVGEETENYAQGYFVYDSRKAGSVTTSHLRFGPEPINAPYLIEQAHFVACHQFGLLERLDVLKHARPGAAFFLSRMRLAARRSMEVTCRRHRGPSTATAEDQPGRTHCSKITPSSAWVCD